LAHDDTGAPVMSEGVSSLLYDLGRRGQIAFDTPVGKDERLVGARQLRYQSHRSLFGARVQKRIECRLFHATGSTNTSTLPPQARPTPQACSSVTPKSSSRGFPSLITSRASRTTAPSMQPPETEPRKAPVSSTTSWLPVARGEEPQVLTTVARATPLPAARHSAACRRISSASSKPATAFSAIRSLLPAAARGVGSARTPSRPDYSDCAQ